MKLNGLHKSKKVSLTVHLKDALGSSSHHMNWDTISMETVNLGTLQEFSHVPIVRKVSLGLILNSTIETLIEMYVYCSSY